MGLSTLYIPGDEYHPDDKMACTGSFITLDDSFLEGVKWGWTGPRDDNGKIVLDVEHVTSLRENFYHRGNKWPVDDSVVRKLDQFLKDTVLKFPDSVVTLS